MPKSQVILSFERLVWERWWWSWGSNRCSSNLAHRIFLQNFRCTPWNKQSRLSYFHHWLLRCRKNTGCRTKVYLAISCAMASFLLKKYLNTGYRHAYRDTFCYTGLNSAIVEFSLTENSPSNVVNVTAFITPSSCKSGYSFGNIGRCGRSCSDIGSC